MRIKSLIAVVSLIIGFAGVVAETPARGSEADVHAALQRFKTEGRGVISEIHQSPIPQDAWHYGSGFLSGRSVQAITYHREFGEIGRARVAMMDGENG